MILVIVPVLIRVDEDHEDAQGDELDLVFAELHDIPRLVSLNPVTVELLPAIAIP